MEKVFNLIEELYKELTNNVEIKKEVFHERLKQLNDMLTEALDDIKINNSKFDSLLIKKPEDRIKELDYQLSNLSSGPEMLAEAVRLGEDKMRLFLKNYNIGFLRNISLNQSGMFIVEIPCSITKHTAFHDKDYSKQIEFNHQMEVLESIGLEIKESTTSPP